MLIINNLKLDNEGDDYLKENFFTSNANKWSDKIMHRTEAFFDAVIAIAITMIALEISLPDIEVFDYIAFKMLCQETTIYFISFIALASIWTVHAWIYAANDCLGKPLDIFINIILMFFITLFPVFTKLLSTVSGTFLSLIYLGCYIIMEILLLFLLINANHISSQEKLAVFHDIPELLEISQKQTSDLNIALLKERMQLLKKYSGDPSAFPLLYQEMVANLPLAVQRKITDREQKQRTQKTMLILFFTISFLVVTASVLSMMWNPYLSYIFSTVGIIIFIICSIILRYKERGC